MTRIPHLLFTSAIARILGIEMIKYSKDRICENKMQRQICLLLFFALALSCAATPVRQKGTRLFSRQSETALTMAVYEGDAERIKSLLSKGANINEHTTYGQTPLIAASEIGHIEIVKLLLAAGADVNGNNRNGWTVFRVAAERQNYELAKVLIDAGAKVDSPVFIAALWGDIPMATNAIAGGGNVNGRDLVKFRETPLIRAASNGHVEMVDLLLRNKASVNAAMKGQSEFR